MSPSPPLNVIVRVQLPRLVLAFGFHRPVGMWGNLPLPAPRIRAGPRPAACVWKAAAPVMPRTYRIEEP